MLILNHFIISIHFKYWRILNECQTVKFTATSSPAYSTVSFSLRQLETAKHEGMEGVRTRSLLEREEKQVCLFCFQ